MTVLEAFEWARQSDYRLVIGKWGIFIEDLNGFQLEVCTLSSLLENLDIKDKFAKDAFENELRFRLGRALAAMPEHVKTTRAKRG